MIEGAPNDMMQHQGEPSLSHASPSPSPSFSSYSSETLADIAARVIDELRRHPQNDHEDDDPFFQPWENDNDDDPNQNDDDFSFAFVLRDPNASPVSADDIFYNGQIRPMYMYPLFNNAPLNDAVPSASQLPKYSSHDEASTIRRRLPLRKLMFEERETGSCSSSTSENNSVHNLEGVPEGTYCVWNPNAVLRNRKKSNSTGSSSSKRWKLRELLLRSHSEGKGKKSGGNDDDGDGDVSKREFVFGVPSKRTSKVAAAAAAAKEGSGDGYGGAATGREGKGGRKSVLPYRQELIGLFANVNGLGRNLNPF